MTMPNFLIIGAMKAGTTALFDVLKQHPDVYTSQKEPHFFSYENESHVPTARVVTKLEDYKKLFGGVTDEIAIGEASPSYLIHPEAPERINHYVPDAKLIAVLRHPVERAFSQYWHYATAGEEECTDFVEAFKRDVAGFEKRQGFWWRAYHYQGLYSQHLERYLELFEREQMAIYFFDDFKSNPHEFVRNVFKFLGVDESFVPIHRRGLAKTGKPKSQILYDLLTKSNAIKDFISPVIPSKLRRNLRFYVHDKNVGKQSMKAEIYEELLPVFKDDILKLQDLVQRDLSTWLTRR